MLLLRTALSAGVTATVFRQSARVNIHRSRAAWMVTPLLARVGSTVAVGYAAQQSLGFASTATMLGASVSQETKELADIDWYMKGLGGSGGENKWGFVIYRTAYGGDSDKKFARLLAKLDAVVKFTHECYGRMDLAPFADFHVVEDREAL